MMNDTEIEGLPGYAPDTLGIGDTFVARTHGKRVITGRVNCVDTQEFMRKNPYHVVWTDANGKHHEWFGLQEFAEFTVTRRK